MKMKHGSPKGLKDKDKNSIKSGSSKGGMKSTYNNVFKMTKPFTQTSGNCGKKV